MYQQNKRRASGSMMPNFYFTLQLTIIVILSYIFIKLAPILNLSSVIMYAMTIVAIALIISCLGKRHTVIKRQKI